MDSQDKYASSGLSSSSCKATNATKEDLTLLPLTNPNSLPKPFLYEFGD